MPTLLLCFFLLVWFHTCSSFRCCMGSLASRTTHKLKVTEKLHSTATDWNQREFSAPSASNNVIMPRNLRQGSTVIGEDPLLQGWNELKGLSEKDLVSMGNHIDIMDIKRDSQALNLAYKRCEYVTKLFSQTFYMGTNLMPKHARQQVWAIYAWCRRTDDIVDSPRALLSRDTLRIDLQEWGRRLDALWSGQPADLFDLALSDTVRLNPTMRKLPFQDMIKGMVMDVPGLGQERYESFEQLYLYCYRVAGTVGLMTLPILGVNTAQGYTEEQARGPAEALGVALQLTNILRDVGEDLERGRIYLPQEDLRAFGVSEEQLVACRVTPQYVRLMQFQIERARHYYALAAQGIPMLAPAGRFAVQASLELYGRILDVIERNGYDNFNKRAFTTKLEKLSLLPRAYYRSQFAKATSSKS